MGWIDYSKPFVEKLEKIEFPTYITASFTYMATGEGITYGGFTGYCLTAEDALNEIRGVWGGNYFLFCADVQQGRHPDMFPKHLIPPQMKKIDDKYGPCCDYKFMLHFNLS